MVKVVLQSTGQTVLLAGTPEFFQDLEEWRATECNRHDDTFWTRFPTTSGAVQIRRQCRNCGYILGQPRKQQPGDENLPLADRNAYEIYRAARKSAEDKILQKHAEKQASRENSWFAEYNDYLRSDEWRAKRALVFKRSGGQCEGCGLAVATQVHHLHYRHFKEEFLFELVAVCDPCHSRLHPDNEEPAAESDPDQAQEWEDHPCNGCRYASEQNGKHHCFILDEPLAVALATDGDCGPDRAMFEHLR